MIEKQYTIKEAADVLRVHDRSVRRYIADGKLAAAKTAAGKWLISEDAIASFLRGETAENGANGR